MLCRQSGVVTPRMYDVFYVADLSCFSGKNRPFYMYVVSRFDVRCRTTNVVRGVQYVRLSAGANERNPPITTARITMLQ